MPEVAASSTHLVYADVPFIDVVYSLATENPGALVLHNYPRHLQNGAPMKHDGWVWGALFDNFSSTLRSARPPRRLKPHTTNNVVNDICF